MFKQQKNVADATLFAQFNQAPLQAEAGSIVNRSDLDDGDQNANIYKSTEHGGTERISLRFPKFS